VCRAGQDGPCHPRNLVRERDYRLVAMDALDQPVQPPTERVLVSIEVQETGPCAVDQQLAHIGVASFADTKKHWPAAGRILSRHEP
jgi:hypothetical protein